MDTATSLRLRAREIRQIAGWKNVGNFQTERILRETNNETETRKEGDRRERLAEKLLDGDDGHFFSELVNNIADNWIVLCGFLDGQESPIAQKILKSFPEITAFIEVELADPLKSSDYSLPEEGLPGYDWSLFDKAIYRAVGKKLSGLIKKDFDLFTENPLDNGLEKHYFNDLAATYQKVINLGIAPAINTTILTLDYAKGGDASERTKWQTLYPDYDPLIHNRSSALLLEGEKFFEKRQNVKGFLADFCLTLIREHGIIGQYIRGEASILVFQEFTDWVFSHKKDLDKLLGDFRLAVDIFFLINIIDTSAVSRGIYTNALHLKFEEAKNLILQFIEKKNKDSKYSWDQVMIDVVEKSSERKILVERISNLRGNSDLSDVKSFILNLDKAFIQKYFAIFYRSYLWYAEPATSCLTVESQMKIFFLAARVSEILGEKKLFHLNFIKLVHTLCPDRILDKVKVKIIENILTKISWEDLASDPFIRDLTKNLSENKVSIYLGKLANKKSVEVDFKFTKDAVSACDTINSLFASGENRTNFQIQQAIRLLEQLYGIAQGILDRGLSEDFYKLGMNAAMEDKRKNIISFLSVLKEESGQPINFSGPKARSFPKESLMRLTKNLAGNGELEPSAEVLTSSLSSLDPTSRVFSEPIIKIASLGAGTGKLEEDIAQIIPNSEVYGLDISDQMIADINKRAKSLDIRRQEGEKVGKLIGVKTDIFEMEKTFPKNSLNAVVASSDIHEFCSFLDSYSFGENTKKIIAQVASILKPGGILIIRDFVLPDDFDQMITLRIGEKQKMDDVDPQYFINQFVSVFKGFTHQNAIASQKDSKEIKLSVQDSLEILVHYSWAKSFVDEVKEKYFYFTLDQYSKTLIDIFKKAGYGCAIEKAYSYKQPDYDLNVNGRIDRLDASGKPFSFPPITGVIVAKKLPS